MNSIKLIVSNILCLFISVIFFGQENITSKNQTDYLYPSYTNLVMAGYQGWFATVGDDSNRGWHHYGIKGGDTPGRTTIDMWPDMTEYAKKYKSPFQYSNGSSAYLYSPYDEETVDLHFKWMKEYGIDGVHMQRFVSEIKSESGKRHFNKVLDNALKAAKKHGRVISIMYDLSGCKSEDLVYLEKDWDALQKRFNLFDTNVNPTFLRHHGKPLMSIWGVGFNDGRKYRIEDVANLVNVLKGPTNKVSIMLGVPYYWRTLTNDTEDTPALHHLIKQVDIIMPWAVGRYNINTYNNDIVIKDVQWAKKNNIDYVPLVYPGFTWGNLKRDTSLYNLVPREKGNFLWKQIAGAKQGGAESLYVAMFDEIDEGTAIFKVKLENEVPLNGSLGYKFVGLDKSLKTDYYLWLTGQATKWFHNDGSFGKTKPTRN